MKNGNGLLGLFLVILLICGSVNVWAMDGENIPIGREGISSEIIGTAILTDSQIALLSEEGSSCTITPGVSHNYGYWVTNEFAVITETGTHLGFCAQPNSPTPNGIYTVSELNNDTIKALILCYIVPELYNAIGVNLYNQADNNMYAYCHAAIGYVYCGSLTGLSTNMANGVKHMVDVVRLRMADNATLQRYMQQYNVYVAYNDSQDIVWAEYKAEGSLKLVKTSLNPDITEENSLYSLADAIYGIYSDQACTNKVDELITASNGISDEVNLEAGNYWVKELVAPMGYALDESVYSIGIESGKVTTLEVEDLPQSDPTEIVLYKKDAQTSANIPQGNAILENAEFVVKFYAGYYETDPSLEGKMPLRVWNLKTDKDGYSYLNDTYKISGDEFYYSLDKTAVLPLGTITVQETKAPDGYLINNEVFVQKITPQGSTEKVETYVEPIIFEEIMELNIVKKSDAQQRIPGTVFLHTMPDGTTEEVITDENGNALIKGLTRGEHIIEEISVLDGYLLNPGKVVFAVSGDNQITVISNTAKAETGQMIFTADDPHSIVLEVEDILVPYKLIIHKTNESGIVLEGAEFGLYSDLECLNEIEKKTSDEKGEIVFSDLKCGMDYYIKETKAPQGYRIKTDEDGNGIVYKIKAESDPINNIFKYCINDKEYTEEMNEYHVTGTKSDRNINITIRNQQGIEMPETGKSNLFFILLGGAGCMAYHLVTTYKRKNEDKK